MQYFFQDSFISKVKELLKNNSYQDCELAIIKCIFDKSFDDIKKVCAASRLNASSENPIAKLRISFSDGKSSAYRLYVHVTFKNNKFYFAHIYPKKGTKGQQALESKEEKEIIKELLKNIKEDKIIEIFLDKKKNKICYQADNQEVF